LGPSPERHRILQPRSETYDTPGPGVRGETEEADHLLRVRVVSVGHAVVRWEVRSVNAEDSTSRGQSYLSRPRSGAASYQRQNRGAHFGSILVLKSRMFQSRVHFSIKNCFHDDIRAGISFGFSFKFPLTSGLTSRWLRVTPVETKSRRT
jgi:hypothetical protein